MTHFWNFDDGTGEHNTTEQYIEHVFMTRGHYNVTCLSMNSVSSKNNITSIISTSSVIRCTVSIEMCAV